MRKPFRLSLLQLRWILPLAFIVLSAIFLLFTAIANLGSMTSSSLTYKHTEDGKSQFNSNVNHDPDEVFSRSPLFPLDMPVPPRFAYLISGTKGDANRMKRLLLAIYHPRNHYLFHLDLEAPLDERIILTTFVKQFSLLRQENNVWLIEKPNMVTYKGSSMIACTLHGASMLLKDNKQWDWFINLSATDYPLVTQDDLLHVFSYIPKDFNFMEHTSNLGWREFQRAKPIIIDPGLFLNKKSDVFWVTQRRALPQTFRLFIGSAWMILTRNFVEYCIHGWDNLPRTLLLYFTNFVSSPEGYFQTVLCNAKNFRNTTVNHDLHYILWDNPPKQHPITLTMEHFANMTASGAAFARKFIADDAVLDKIDEELLGRKRDHVIPGAWCVGSGDWDDPCSVKGDPNILSPGPGAKRLEALVLKKLSTEVFRSNQCA